MKARDVDLGGHPGLLLRPRVARFLLVLAHGAGAGMRHPFMSGIAEALAAEGIATARYEFPSMAAGRRRPDAPAVARAAVREAWRAARARAPGLPAFAGGKSFGGRMTSGAHAERPLEGLSGLVFLGFPLHPPGRPAIERAAHLVEAAGPLLFIQGERDALADLALLRPLVAGLGRRAVLHVVEGGDHGFAVPRRAGRTQDEVLAEVAGQVARWMERVAHGPRRARPKIR